MASISEPFIRRPVGTTLLAIGLFLVGCVAYGFLPVAAVPTGAIAVEGDFGREGRGVR